MPDQAPSLELRLNGHRAAAVSHDLTIGRDPSCDVVLNSEHASRCHGRLAITGGVWVYEDSGSQNGTYVDGKRVARLEVRSHVTLRLGSPHSGDILELAVASVGESRRPHPIGTLTSVRATAPVLRIGRAPENDVVLPELTVSRHHAELRAQGDKYVVVDLNSFNGTFVNGQEIAGPCEISSADVLSIGKHAFQLAAGRLQEFVDLGAVTFTALDLSVALKGGGQRLLSDVTFTLPAKSLLAVLGPTGAGKSTLLNALTGFRPASAGKVLYAGHDLYRNYDQLRQRIGYVPQDDILHTQLALRSALEYAAELRFPPDTTRSERDGRIDEVLGELGLADRAGIRIDRLSGGQRKRTNVAVELLTRPSLLFLDEPTSGLDPGYQRSVMRMLRRMAQDGRTIVLVTHTLQGLELCDRVLFLAPGGRMAFFGPPAEALSYFDRSDFAEVFDDLERDHATDWAARFRQRSGYHRYVAEPITSSETRVVAQTQVHAGHRADWRSQMWTLIRRYVAVLVSDRRSLALLGLQAPLLGLLMARVFAPDQLGTAGGARKVLLALVLATTWLGASNSVREFAKERTVYLRERSVGLLPSGYLMSKVAVLAAITIMQAVVVTLLALIRQQLPDAGATVSPALVEMLIGLSAVGVAAMMMGLLISAIASTPDRAVFLLPVILIAQLVLSGGLFEIDEPPLREVSALAVAKWGFSAVASTSNLQSVESYACDAAPAGCVEWSEDRSAWPIHITALALILSASGVGAWLALRKARPV